MYVKPTRETTADQVTDAVFGAILAGELEPGAPLRLQQIAEQMGVSMMPVREALRRLEVLGLIEIVPYKGAFLRPLTRSDLIDTYATRIHLETLAVRQAAPRFTDEDAGRAQQALEDQWTARDRGDQIAARNSHERFHFTLYEASGSAWMARCILPAWRNSERYRVQSMRRAAAEERAREHKRILAAMKAHDADLAVAELLVHLRRSVDLVAQTLPGAGDIGSELPTLDDLLSRVPSNGAKSRPAAKRKKPAGAGG